MTKDEITREYTIDKYGLIRNPGQFEGQMFYVPHFWERSLEGCAEEIAFMEDGCGEYVCLVLITLDEQDEFALGTDDAYCSLIQSSTGFISGNLLSIDEAKQFRADWQHDWEEPT